MNHVAVLVDGGFYRKRAQNEWGSKSPAARAKELIRYCNEHVHYLDSEWEHRELYRIFYYDCPPYGENVYHPLLKKDIYYGKTELFIWMNEFLDELRHQRKLALRLGSLSSNAIHFDLKYRPLKKLLSGEISVNDLSEDDFELNIIQKGVDMRIGIDIASMAYKHQVSTIVLISDDSDFVPAAKLARREGIDVVLDPMWNHVNKELFEHIDGLHSCFKRPI